MRLAQQESNLDYCLLLPSTNEEPHAAAQKGFVTEWLLCGPFPTQTDMFFIDYLKNSGGEESIVPHQGLEIQRPDGKSAKWTPYAAREDGLVNFVGTLAPSFAKFWDLKDRIGYAYTSIETEAAQQLVLAIGSEDQIQIWLNGEPIHLSLASRSARPAQEIIVADFEQGVNHLLVKLGRRSGQWGFYLQLLNPGGKLFINKTELVGGSPHDEEQYLYLPDLYVGEQIDAWGYIPVTNISAGELSKISLKVEGNKILCPTSSELEGLNRGETGKIPFRLQTRQRVQPEDSTQVILQIEAAGETHELSLEPRLRNPGQHYATSYISKADGSVQPFRIVAPEVYDSDKTYALVLGMHGYKGDSTSYESYRSRPWVFVAAPCARGQVPYREIGTWDVLEIMQAMQQRYNIDADRIYLTGHSMGGRGTWSIGLSYPDLFAVLAPFAGNSTLAKPLAENALNVQSFVGHGALDSVVDPEHSRKIVSIFEKLENPVTYKEIPGADHWWTVQEGGREVCPPDDPELFEFFAQHRRSSHPRKVIYKTNNLRFSKAYWTRIDQLEKHGSMAQLCARVESCNRIEVEVENITGYTLQLDKKLVDMDKEVVINTNGLTSFTGLPTTEISLGYSEGAWQIAAKGKMDSNLLHKRADLCGPIIEAFNAPFLLVYGNSGNAEDTQTNQKEARWAQLWWQFWANGNTRIKPDYKITPADMENYNLILYGNAASNQIIAQINDYLPIRFAADSIIAGEENFAGRNVALQMIYPNPLCPAHYVVINGGVSCRGTANIHKTGLEIMDDYFPSSTSFDYAIFDADFIGNTENRYLKSGYFDGHWQLQL